MSDLEKTLAQPTMSSIELLALINQARAAFNEPEVRRNQFNARVEDELEGAHYKKTVVTNENGTESIVFELTQDQCMLVSMRESKAVRRWVLDKLKAMGVPQTMAQALRLAADQAEKIEQQQAQLALAAPKVNFFDKVVERTTLMTATQVAQKLGMSAIKLNKLNKHLDELGIYAMGVKRARVFKQWVIDKGLGELKQTELGYSQPLFTTAGEAWIVERLTSEGVAC